MSTFATISGTWISYGFNNMQINQCLCAGMSLTCEKNTTIPRTPPQKNASGFIKSSPSERRPIHSHYGRQSHKSIWDKLSGTNGRAKGEQVKGLRERFASSRASCLVVQQEGWDEAGDKI